MVGSNVKVKEQVLLASNRICAICVWFYSDWQPKKKVQVAHIDRNKSNNNSSNLVVLCLDHHDEYDSTPSQSKKIIPSELQRWKHKVEEKVVKDFGIPDSESVRTVFTVKEIGDIDLADQKVTQALERLSKRIEKSKKESIRMLLVGRTGVGKSSTINRLIGQNVAPVGEFEPETVLINKYALDILGFTYEIFDTPGLCDDLPYKGKDNIKINDIKEKIGFVDLLLYVTSLPDTRVTGDEKRGIRLVTKGLGKKVWKHALVVFTHSANVPKKNFKRCRENRTRLLLEEIQKNAPYSDMTEEHCVCIDNKKNLKGKDVGISELWLQTFLRIEKRGFLQFLLSQSSRVEIPPPVIKSNEKETPLIYPEVITPSLPQLESHESNKEIIIVQKENIKKNEIIKSETKSNNFIDVKNINSYPQNNLNIVEYEPLPKIELNERQVKKFQKRVNEDAKDVLTVAAGTALGAGIGSIAGPVGTLIGGAIGAAVTAISRLFRKRR